jgi:hypothetical protein
VLEALARHKIPFMIVGLSAAVLQGAPVVTQDVDLWVRDMSDPQFSVAMQSIGAAYVPPFGYHGPMLAGEGTELFDLVTHMHGLGKFDDEFPNTLSLRLGRVTIRVLRLERILASKEAANREKDRLTIPVLRNTLRSHQAKASVRKARRSKNSPRRPRLK